MLNPTKLKTYATAYNIRLKRGESLESIDKLYLDMKRLDWNSDFFMIYDGMRIRSTVPIKMKYYERYMYDED